MGLCQRVAICLWAALLCACGPDAPPAPPAAAATATPVAVDPAKLGRLYLQTCMACHTSPGSGAPQAGDRAAWAPRVAQGMDALLAHTIDGYKGMPPLGSCMDCTEAEFEALIRFMAGA